MVQRKLPFENRWASGEHAWQWYCELERIGTENVRVMFADHECHHPEDQLIVADVPPPFVRDWLAYHDRLAARLEMRWRVSMVALAFIAALASLYSAFRWSGI
jgi:hypothetical protein